MSNYMKEVTMSTENGVEAFYDDDVGGIREIISLIPM